MLNYIVIVEDNKELADALVGMIKDYEQEAVAFYDAESALEYIRITSNKIGLALVDMGLPDMSGTDFSRDLYTTHPQIPVIIFTGLLQQDIDTSKTHIVERLQKPVDLFKLNKIIQKHKDY